MSVPPLHKLIADVLKDRPGERMTPADIAEVLIAAHPLRFAEKERGLAGLKRSIHEQVAREVYANRDALRRYGFVSEDKSRRPLRLFFEADRRVEETPSPAPLIVEAPDARSERAQSDFSEHDLYGPLQIFLFRELGIVSKRIRETTSSNARGKGANKWLHPDIVGMLAPGTDWSPLIQECSAALPTSKAKLIAVEVKRRLSVGNVREAFFQTVSNSLWASRGYLAAVDIDGDTYDELTMLCALHGVGYISIDPENPAESRVEIPARERDEVDWASANRIASENPDFRAYLQNVLNYLRSGNVMPQLWEHTQVG